ncbi:MAG: Gfo/Idh/MocA family oxidoreductase [Firmicutes bacterium]|nr:Gfo/Idh/MocA family oxidoreductase [Bacillota bacterium]
MRKLKVALVGCGRVSSVHAAALHKLDETELAVAVDVKADRAKETAETYGCRWTTDYREVLKDKEIDAVEICTPHYLHAEMAIAAARAGKHILTEKPMALSVADANAMIKAADENGVALGVIFQNRYNEASQAVKRAIERGELGTLRGTRAFLTWDRSDDYYRDSDWKGTWDKEGGGVLIDQAIHTIDQMQWLVGEVDFIQATYSTRAHDFIKVDDVAEAYLKFKNGAVGCLYANCFYTYDADVFLEVQGDKGVAQILKDVARIKIGNETRIVEPTTDNPTLGKGYWGMSHSRQIEKFYRALLRGEKPEIDGHAGKAAMQIVLAMYESARRGEPVYFK